MIISRTHNVTTYRDPTGDEAVGRILYGHPAPSERLHQCRRCHAVGTAADLRRFRFTVDFWLHLSMHGTACGVCRAFDGQPVAPMSDEKRARMSGARSILGRL